MCQRHVCHKADVEKCNSEEIGQKTADHGSDIGHSDRDYEEKMPVGMYVSESGGR